MRAATRYGFCSFCVLLHAAAAWGGDVVLVKDVNRGGYGSYPSGFFEVSPGRMVFTASDAEHGRELWTTDGSSEGTRLLVDLAPGSADSTSGEYAFIALGERALFFSRAGAGAPLEMWSTDGTPAGTVRLSQWSDNSAGATFIGRAGGRVLIKTTVNSAPGLYATDGTSELPVLLATGVTFVSNPLTITYSGSLFFVARTSAAGNELWRSDGTPAGTGMVRDLTTGSGGSDPRSFVVYRSLLYFVAYTPATGFELWRTDGTDAGTTLVLDLLPGPTGSNPTSLVTGNDRLFFVAPDVEDPRSAIYSYRPEVGPTQIFFNTPTTAGIGSLLPFGEGVAFTAPDRVYQDTTNIWTADENHPWGEVRLEGQASGVPISFIKARANGYFINRQYALQFTDILSGTAVTLFPSARYTTFLGQVGDLDLIAVQGGPSDSSRMFWLTDGSLAGTRPFTTATGVTTLHYAAPLSDGRVLYASTTAEGNEPWASDGTAQGTFRLRDVDLRTYGSNIRQGFVLNGRFFFYREGANSTATIWTSRGTPESTRLSFDATLFDPLQSTYVNGNVLLGDWLYVRASSYTQGPGYHSRLYRTDGTQDHTELVYDTTGFLDDLLAVGSEVWFRRSSIPSGAPQALYRTDGTPGGTREITTKVVNPRRAAAAGNGAAYLTSEVLSGSSSSRYRLWFTDGTDLGTRVVWTAPADNGSDRWHLGAITSAYFCVNTYDPSSQSDRYSIVRVDGSGTASVTAEYAQLPSVVGDLGGGDIVFFVWTGTMTELIRTTGGGAGVQTIMPLSPYTLCSPSCVASARLGDALYFSATNSGSDGEPWRTDGTPEGTYRLADVYPGSHGSYSRNFFSDGRALYFVATTLSGVMEIWKSDGSETGTSRLTTLYRKPSGPWDPIVLGGCDDGVFFSADNPWLGVELHVYRAGSPDCNQNMIHDAVEVETGLSIDVNGDGRPDGCCLADFNSDGQATLEDLFDFLQAWFGGAPTADINGRDGVGLQDLFDFLGAWFATCE